MRSLPPTLSLFLFILLLLFNLPPSSYAQSSVVPNGTLIIATKITEPFVFQDANGALRGYSVDLMTRIAQQVGFSIVWNVYPGVSDLISSLDVRSSVKADLSICSTTITESRAKIVDFSTGMFSSGLHIMVPYTPPNQASKSLATLKAIFSPLFWQTIGILLSIIVVSSIIFYFLEHPSRHARKHGSEDAVIRSKFSRGGLEDSIS